MTARVEARGGSGGGKGSSHHSSSVGPGTGAKGSSTHVSGYNKKNGTDVDAHDRSTSDHNFNNNWSTKGNENPKTGKEGTRVTPPNK